jgi:hypothetical protein
MDLTPGRAALAPRPAQVIANVSQTQEDWAEPIDD